MTGRYRLVESIGQGGMGRVWRAADEMLDRQVAVKEMRIDGLDAEDTRTRRERTLREARATARIDHPNVVRVYDVVDEGERLWIVMELVNGRSLERMTVEDGPLGPRETALLGLGLVRALRQVHARGVLHRDIKPGNVLVESADRAGHRIVLTDFGIAAMQDAKALTMVGMLVGSPDYMAPERVSGRPQGPPSDIWSLGATMCAALGGRSPFSRDTTLATLHAVLYEEPELPAAAGPLTDILAALLEKDPSIRPDLDDVESALHTVAFPVPAPTLRMGPGDDTGPAEPGERRGSGLAADEADEQGPVGERGSEDGAGAQGGRERRQGDPGQGESARASGAGGVDPARASGADREDSARRSAVGPVNPAQAAGPGRGDGAGTARGRAAGEEDGDREPRPGDPGRVDSARAPGTGRGDSAGVPGAGRVDSAGAPNVVGVDSAGAQGVGRGDSARAPVVGRADTAQVVGPGRDDGAQTSETTPVTERARAVRDPRVPEPETGPGAAVDEPAGVEPSDAVPVGHAFSGTDVDEGTGTPSDGVQPVADVAGEPVGERVSSDVGDGEAKGVQPVADVAGAAVGESVREPAVVEPSDAVPPGFALAGVAGDGDSGTASDGFPPIAEAVAPEPEPLIPAEPLSPDRVASASSEAASEERSEVRSETPSGSAVGAALRAGATTASTPLAGAPTQDSLSAGVPTEHFPMPDAPTRDTPARAASAPTRVGPVPAAHRRSGPGVSLVRGEQAVPDQRPAPGPASGRGVSGTAAGTGSPGPASGRGVSGTTAGTGSPGPASGRGVSGTTAGTGSPGPASGRGVSGTAAGTGSSGSAVGGPGVGTVGPGSHTGTSHTDGPAANLRTDNSSTDGQDPAPALILGPHPHRMPPGEPPGPARPATPHRGRRRTALVAAGSTVAAGVAVVAIILATSSGSPGDDQAGGSPSVSGSASVSAPESGASTPAGTPSSTVAGTSRPRSLPPGAHEEAGGFAWATPTGWRRDVKTGAEVHYTSPDGKQELAAKSSLARGDLMETWRTSEQNAHQGQDYAKIRLEETTFRDHPAVVWEYTFTLGGVPWHAQLLGFNVGDKSYQINTWYRPDTETQALKTYEKVKDSFTIL